MHCGGSCARTQLGGCWIGRDSSGCSPRPKINGRLTFPLVGLQASAELAATYAALILADDGIEITVSTLSRTSAKIRPS